MKKFIGKFGGRFAVTLAVLAAALALTACGGGGGGGSVATGGGVIITPPPTVPQTILLTTGSVAIDGKKDVPVTASTTVTVSVSPSGFATSSASDFIVTSPVTVTCNGVKQNNVIGAWTVAAAAPNATTYTATTSVSFTGAPNNATCIIAGNVTATRGSVSSNTLPFTATFTTVAAPVAWWPPTFVSQSVAVFLDAVNATSGSVVNALYPGQTQTGMLPAACKITGDDCWKEAVRNGTIKFAATIAKNPNQPTRPIAFSSYKAVSTILFPGKTVYCTKPFFADDGTLVDQNDPVENRCVTFETVYIMSNNLGVITKEKNPDTGVSTCFQRNYSTQANGWISTTATCPQ